MPFLPRHLPGLLNLPNYLEKRNGLEKYQFKYDLKIKSNVFGSFNLTCSKWYKGTTGEESLGIITSLGSESSLKQQNTQEKGNLSRNP